MAADNMLLLRLCESPIETNLVEQSTTFMDDFYKYAQIFNIVLILAACLAGLVLLYVFACSPHFHPNFVALILAVIANYSVFNLSRLVLACYDFQCSEKECFFGHMFLNKSVAAVEVAKLFTTFFYACAIPIILLERAVATICLSTYEKNKFSFLIFLVLLIPILCSAWLTFTVFKCTINVWIVGSFAELMCALFVLGIRLIDNINQRRYRHSWTTGNAYTLSERYQLAENIRSGKIMRRSITVASFGLFFGIIFFFSVYVVRDLNAKRVFKICFDLNMDLLGIIFSIVSVNASHVWREIFWRALNRLKKRLCMLPRNSLKDSTLKTVSPKTTSNMKTSSGKKMVFKVEEERDLYFCQLRDSWR